MITSQFIIDIFDLSFDNHSEGDLIRKQIPFLFVKDTEHSGIGAFIHFVSDNQLQQFKVDSSNTTIFAIEGNPTDKVDEIEIINQNLSILAETIIWLKNGVIDHLEIFNKCGEKYVLTEPEHYELKK